MKIAVVEDDESVRQSYVRVLQLEGYEVEAYGSGEAFVSSDSFHGSDLVVVDFRLPGISGLEVVQTARYQALTTPFILVSGGPGVIADGVGDQIANVATMLKTCPVDEFLETVAGFFRKEAEPSTS